VIPSLDGKETCCGGLTCQGPADNSTCVAPPPRKVYIWDIPGTIPAGYSNSEVDRPDANNIGGTLHNPTDFCLFLQR
jgi:hypothetical protein